MCQDRIWKDRKDTDFQKYSLPMVKVDDIGLESESGCLEHCMHSGKEHEYGRGVIGKRYK